MQLIINNLTGSTKTYLSSTVSVSGNSSLSITSISQQLSLSTDGQFRYDLFANFIQITDGINTYSANDALDYLALIAQNFSYNFIASPASAAVGVSASVGITGALSIAPPAGTLFIDAFDSTGLDTINRWTLVTANGGTDTQSLGTNTLATTTVASSQVSLSTQPTFMPTGSSYSGGVYVQYESVLQINTHGFWGFGTPAASFTAATPLLNAVGFEIDLMANLNAVVYSNGTKIFSANLNAYKNINPNLFVITYRADAVFFFINSFEIPVASAVGYNIDALNLPFRIHRINSTTPPVSSTSLAISAAAVVDSNPNAVTNISDGTYGWRKAKVDANGNLSTSTKISLTSSSPTASTVGTSTILVLAANANRKGLILTNTSTSKIFLGLGASAILNSGIVLYPGGSWTMDEYNFTTVAINAIASITSSNLAIQEFST